MRLAFIRKYSTYNYEMKSDHDPNQELKTQIEPLETTTKEKTFNISGCLEEIQRTLHTQNTLGGLLKEWSTLIGEPLASNCKPIALQRGVLLIGASHPQWLQALQYNRMELLEALKKSEKKIKDIKIQRHHSSKKEENTISEKQIWQSHPSRIDIHGIAKCKSCGAPGPAGEIKIWGVCGFCRRIQFTNKPN